MKMTQQKLINDVLKEIKLLTNEAVEVKEQGGNHFNIIAEIEQKAKTLQNLLK